MKRPVPWQHVRFDASVNLSCVAGNATSINVELSKQGRCTKLADGHDRLVRLSVPRQKPTICKSSRWVNDLAPTPGTPKEDLKEFGLALVACLHGYHASEVSLSLELGAMLRQSSRPSS